MLLNDLNNWFFLVQGKFLKQRLNDNDEQTISDQQPNNLVVYKKLGNTSQSNDSINDEMETINNQCFYDEILHEEIPNYEFNSPVGVIMDRNKAKITEFGFEDDPSEPDDSSSEISSSSEFEINREIN